MYELQRKGFSSYYFFFYLFGARNARNAAKFSQQKAG